MKQATTLLLLFISFIAFAQEKKVISSELINAIKKDVWVPFMQSYATLDSEMLKSIHSSDIVRITIDQNEIETGEAYIDHFGGFLEIVKERGSQVAIAFSISSTATNENETVAYQTGYYRLSSKRKDDKEMLIRAYGAFQVGLRKENDTWKIWLDSDKNADISHDYFNQQQIIYELAG
ncbi:hypothetical protein [Flagellimonas onchidii]|uniref:hypothetical protein n=1 Tax=Flagellimonas onchidii TaxID=2562684 RepID=UPI0010A60088|nr:hypothetical protein [Allomuricauda onchidii]